MDNQEKSAYREKMEAKLTKLDAEIQRLEGEWKEKKAEARLDTQEEIRQLRQRHEGVKAKLYELKTATGAAWDQAKDGMASAWNDLESSFQKASAEFKQH